MRIRYAQMVVAVALVLLGKVQPALAQVPAPPITGQQDQLFLDLVDSLQSKNLGLYSSLLSDDLKVFEDGTEVASSKKSWAKSFGDRLTAPGVVFKVRAGYASSGKILLTEYENSVMSWGSKTPKDCCWNYTAVSYLIRDGKIAVIRRLTGGPFELKVGD